MCKIKPYPPRVGGTLSATSAKTVVIPGTFPAAVDTVADPPKFDQLVDRRAQLPAPSGSGADSVLIAVTDVLTWLGSTAVPPTGVTFQQARNGVFNGNMAVLPPTLSVWREKLAGGSVIIAEMYVDQYFFAADIPLTGGGGAAGDRIVNTFDDQLANPGIRTVIVVGSFVEATDHHSEHPSGRYLVRSGLGASWGNGGVAWVSQKVARYRFIDGFAVK